MSIYFNRGGEDTSKLNSLKVPRDSNVLSLNSYGSALHVCRRKRFACLLFAFPACFFVFSKGILFTP